MQHLLLSKTIVKSKYIHEFLKHYISSKDTILVVLYSFFTKWFKNKEMYQDYYKENSHYDNKIKLQFSSYGAKIEYLNYYNDNEDTREKKINDATVLFFPGGSPDQMMDRLKKHNLIEKIKKFKGITIGSSAGAMIHLDKAHIYKDNDYKKFSYVKGLSFIKDFDFSVHYRRKIQQKKAIRKVWKEKPKDIYSIPDDGGLFYDQGEIHLLGSAKKIYDKNGIINK